MCILLVSMGALLASIVIQLLKIQPLNVASVPTKLKMGSWLKMMFWNKIVGNLSDDLLWWTSKSCAIHFIPVPKNKQTLQSKGRKCIQYNFIQNILLHDSLSSNIGLRILAKIWQYWHQIAKTGIYSKWSGIKSGNLGSFKAWLQKGLNISNLQQIRFFSITYSLT